MMPATDKHKKVGFFDHLYFMNEGKFAAIYNPYSYKGPFVFPRVLLSPLKKILTGKYTVAEAMEKLQKLDMLAEGELPVLIRELRGYDLLSYDGEENRIHLNPLSNPEKGSFWIDLTNQCNFRCSYCYIDRKKEVIDPEKFRLLLDRLITEKDNYPYREIVFVLAGGEPLLYFEVFKKMIAVIKDFQKKYAAEVKTEILAITNGSLLTEERAAYIKKEGVRIALSFDGVEKIHNQTRKFINGTGTYRHVLQGLKTAKKYGILSNVITTVTQKNIMFLPEWVTFLLKQRVGFQLQFYKKVTPSCLDEPLIFNSKSIGSYLKTIRAVYSYYDKKPPGEPTVPIFLDSGKLPFFTSEYACAAGHNYFTITPNCELKVCPTSPIKVAFEKVPNFVEVVREKNRKFVDYSVDTNPVCRECLWKYQCKGGCKMEQLVLKTTDKAPNACAFYKKMIPYLLSLQVKSIVKRNAKIESV